MLEFAGLRRKAPVMSTLVMIPPTPVQVLEQERVVLDKKFVEGMARHCERWPGPVHCILRRGAHKIPFGAEYAKQDLGFALSVIDSDAAVPNSALEDAGLILCSGDMVHELDMWRRMVQAQHAKLVYVVEYTLETRLRIAWHDRGRGALRKLYSMGWNLAQERHRRRAFRAADGVQVNGYPAHEVYGRLNSNCLLYLDNRMTLELFARPEEMDARAAYLRGGGPIRLIHSGRLEPMKGAQDLLPVARGLLDAGVEFTLDIYGTGTLESELSRAAAQPGLKGRVRLHGPVDFVETLVPAARQEADLFLSCHRQSDPSCTYMEAMGCGLPVLGYNNRMWSALQRESGGGWAVPMGRVEALSRTIAELAAARERLLEAGARALAFAQANDFETVFAQRMAHLRDTLAR